METGQQRNTRLRKIRALELDISRVDHKMDELAKQREILVGKLRKLREQ